MQIWTLGTGSKGNALVVEAGASRVLVDAGFPRTVLAARLRRIAIPPESIEGLVVTHEHGDHVCGATTAARRWGWTIHTSRGTARVAELESSRTTTFRAGETVSIGAFDVQTLSSSHDAVDPVVLVLTVRQSGARAGIVYDLGRVSPAIADAVRELDLLVLESNHDPEMLAHGPYPRSLQRRIASSRGHLSNGAAAELARACAHRGLRHVALAHLSQQCNQPRLAMAAVGDALRRTRFAGRLTATTQQSVHGPFAAARRSRASQLSLGL